MPARLRVNPVRNTKALNGENKISNGVNPVRNTKALNGENKISNGVKNCLMELKRLSLKNNTLRQEELLFLCLRSDRKNNEDRLKALIEQGVDWEGFIRIVRKKKVTALTYQALKFYQPKNSLEKQALDKLKLHYLSSSTANNYYLKELKQILSVFMEKNIAVIPLKGITLARRLYGDIALRDESADFDLLVRESDKEKARLILESLSYRLAPEKEARPWRWFYIFTKPRQKMVELHWDITMMVRSPERINGFWQTAELVNSGGMQYYDFSAEELLLYLSAHLVNSDCFRQLRYLCDIERLLEKYSLEINWQRLSEKAGLRQLSGSLYTVLKLNQDLLRQKFPKGALANLKIPLHRRLFIKAFANKKVILKRSFRRRILDIFLSYIFFELVEAGSLKDYLNIFKRVFFPPEKTASKRECILRITKGIAKLFRQLVALKKH